MKNFGQKEREVKMKKQNITRLIYGIIVMLLALAITLQIRTMAKQDSNVSQLLRNDGLKDSLLQ